MCEVKRACLPRVSSHFNTKLIGRSEQFPSEHPLHPSPLPRAASIFMHQFCVPGLGEVKLGQDQTFAARCKVVLYASFCR